ncbi:MAG: type IV pilus secretin PilQ, partial [Janthinobacterium lividum]
RCLASALMLALPMTALPTVALPMTALPSGTLPATDATVPHADATVPHVDASAARVQRPHAAMPALSDDGMEDRDSAFRTAFDSSPSAAPEATAVDRRDADPAMPAQRGVATRRTAQTAEAGEAASASTSVAVPGVRWDPAGPMDGGDAAGVPRPAVEAREEASTTALAASEERGEVFTTARPASEERGEASTTARPASEERDEAFAPPFPAIGERDSAAAEQPSFASGASDSGAPISLDFERAALRDVLQAFARFTGLNIIASPAIGGEATLRLRDVPWRQAFAVLLDAHGLAMRERGRVIWVAPAAEIARRTRDQHDAQARRAAAEPLSSQVFVLHYQRAEDLHRLLTGTGQHLLSKRGAASADVRSNRLFVTDVADRLTQVARMIAAFDLPARQVMIEARIVEADDGVSRNLGVRLGLTGDAAGARITAPGGVVYDLPAAALGGTTPAQVGLTLFRPGVNRLLTLELSALEADGRGTVLSSPRVVTTDRGTAIIEQGTELPYQAKVRNGVSGLQFRRASLRLEVTPHITPDHRVSLDVRVSKDSIGAETAAGAAIDTKHVKTQVEVDNGGTVAIGGIYARTERHDVVGVPGLRRLPLVGALFRRTSTVERRTELIVFITPIVVENVPTAKHSTKQPFSP